MFRKDHEPPAAIARWGWRFHHVGVPTDRPQPEEQYLEALEDLRFRLRIEPLRHPVDALRTG